MIPEQMFNQRVMEIAKKTNGWNTQINTVSSAEIQQKRMKIII